MNIKKILYKWWKGIKKVPAYKEWDKEVKKQRKIYYETNISN
jgi:hypothetical protein